MSVVISGARSISAVKLTGTSATTIIDATSTGFNSAVTVVWLQCTEIAGSTPNLTVELYDGTTSYYLRKSAMSAGERWLFTPDGGVQVQMSWKLRVTAGTANQVDVVASYMTPQGSG